MGCDHHASQNSCWKKNHPLLGPRTELLEDRLNPEMNHLGGFFSYPWNTFSSEIDATHSSPKEHNSAELRLRKQHTGGPQKDVKPHIRERSVLWSIYFLNVLKELYRLGQLHFPGLNIYRNTSFLFENICQRFLFFFFYHVTEGCLEEENHCQWRVKPDECQADRGLQCRALKMTECERYDNKHNQPHHCAAQVEHEKYTTSAAHSSRVHSCFPSLNCFLHPLQSFRSSMQYHSLSQVFYPFKKIINSSPHTT